MNIGSFASLFGALDDAARPLTNNVIPLFVLKRPGEPFLIGSGIPVQLGAVSVVVTASHVLAKYGRASVLTLSNERSPLLLTGERRGFEHRMGSTVDVDLAVIILTEEERAEIRTRYVFSYASRFSATAPPDQIAFYALAGYPQSRNKLSPHLKYRGATEAAYVISRSRVSLSKIRSADKFPKTHFAIGAPEKGAIGLDGARTSFPSTSGISGGGVWRMFFPLGVEALPSARLVGVVIEYCRRPGAFVCTRIQNVEEMVADLVS